MVTEDQTLEYMVSWPATAHITCYCAYSGNLYNSTCAHAVNKTALQNSLTTAAPGSAFVSPGLKLHAPAQNGCLRD
jgi:hypothetical protein